MPELPEVETVVRALRPHLIGREVGEVDVLAPSSIGGSPMSPNALQGKRFEALKRRGKYILADLSEGMGMAVHLRMTGWLGIRPRSGIPKEDAPYVRVVFGLRRRGREGEVLVFRDIRRFGRVWCGPREALLALPALKKLGPEPLEVDCEAFRRMLKQRRGRIKSLLLDQTFVAGLGNIYTDEALFAARIHPQKQACRIGRVAADRLHASIGDVLRRALDAGGSSIDDFRHPDGSPGWFQRALQVYGRDGEACGRCETGIKRIVVGQRGTWFCPRCQRNG